MKATKHNSIKSMPVNEMKNFEFIIWAHGYLELCPTIPLDRKKLYILKNHLNLVKAVEGELGPLNQEIYVLISDHIDKAVTQHQLATLKSKLSEMINELVKEETESRNAG